MDAPCRLCSYLHTHAHDSVLRRVGLMTPREHDVFALLGPGLSTTEIADALDIHPSTVKVHIKSLLNKLETDRRTAGLIALIIHHGRCTRRTSPELASIVDDQIS